MDQVLFQSRFFGRPDVYRLFDVRRRGVQWLALAQERYNEPHKVKVWKGDAGKMTLVRDSRVSYRAASGTFTTSLGDVKTNPGQKLQPSQDITMLLSMTSTFVDQDDLELAVLQALGILATAETTKMPDLAGEWQEGEVKLLT